MQNPAHQSPLDETLGIRIDREFGRTVLAIEQTIIDGRIRPEAETMS
jgi:hypothetical protein